MQSVYDQVGSLRLVIDSSGEVQRRIDYDTFGYVTGDTNQTLDVPFGFAGGLYDPETSLCRFGYRDYDTETGRWTAKDPIFFASGDTNLYGYCVNDPVNWIDPEGLKPPKNIPPGVDIKRNVDTARRIPGIVWINNVREGGDWDYKLQGTHGQYEDLGNYNYGATGCANGWDEDTLQRGSGFIQWLHGPYDERNGKPWGESPYGDQPGDQYWIKEGINDYKRGLFNPGVTGSW